MTCTQRRVIGSLCSLANSVHEGCDFCLVCDVPERPEANPKEWAYGKQNNAELLHKATSRYIWMQMSPLQSTLEHSISGLFRYSAVCFVTVLFAKQRTISHTKQKLRSSCAYRVEEQGKQTAERRW